MNATALWHERTQGSTLKKETLSRPQAGSFEIQSMYSLISSGTERLVATGGVPAELYESMRVPYMGGDLSLPVKYGYSLVGRVSSAGHPWAGKIVHVLHPHQDRCVVSESDCFLVPQGIPPARATLASNLETALNAVWDAGVSAGDRVLLTGFGIIGSLLARLLSMLPAVELTVGEIHPGRQVLALEMGFNVTDAVRPGSNFDLAFNTSASSGGLQSCIDAVGFEGKVIELSWYGNKSVQLELGGSFHQQRKQLISSQVSQLPAGRRARWDYRRRKEAVFRLLRDPAFDRHLGAMIPFEQSPALFDQLRTGEMEHLSYCITYNPQT
jgi:threonine dehydrogenase-like Zn-dependent dehydrogenase